MANSPDDDDLDFVGRRIVYSQKRALDDGLPSQKATVGGGKRRCRRSATDSLKEVDDELARYLAEPPCNLRVYKYDPLKWWQEVGQLQYPRLSYMATDLLTIPSSTAETERQFSSTGRMMTPMRSRMKRHVVDMGQSIRSWSMAGIYTPGLPLNLCEDHDWEQVLHDSMITGLEEVQERRW